MSDYLRGLFSLEGKVAIVTGASRGIGLAIANALLQAGAVVHGLARTRQRPADMLPGVGYSSCDVADEDELTRGIGEFAARSGRLDVLVNAAGMTSVPASDAGGELQRFDHTLRVNLRGAYVACLAARPLMHASGGGGIINITSINSVQGFPGNPGYVAAKGGLHMLTRALALDFASSRIRVNAVAPGYIRTAMTRESHDNPELRAQRVARMIIPRYGEPNDVIGAVIFLASPAAAYITGQDVFVDGGWTAKGL